MRRWHRRPVSELDRRRIAELTYGQVGLTGTRRFGPKQIALALGLRYGSVTLVLRQYRALGGRLPEKQPRKPSSRPPKITPELSAYLLDSATLKAWRGWPMTRRVWQVQQDWGIRFTRPTLTSFYRRHGIGKMLAPFRWRTATTEQQRAWERREWVSVLVRHLQAGREVVYIDETSVNVWDCRARTWMYRTDPLPHVLPKERAHNITVLGAITTKRPGLQYVLSHSTNQAAVQKLVKQVLRGAEDREEVVVVWDNHGAHWSQDVVDQIISSGATLLPLPVNSSDLNPIERVWALLKPRWQHALYTHPGDLQPDEARALLERVLREEVVPRTSNYAHGGRDILLQVLEAKGVLPALGSL